MQGSLDTNLNLANGLLVLLLSGLKQWLSFVNKAAKTSILGVLGEKTEASFIMYEGLFYPSVIYALLCTSFVTKLLFNDHTEGHDHGGKGGGAHRIGRLAGPVGWTDVGAGRQCDGARDVVVGEVLPQQQSLLVLLPCQTVAVVVYFKGLAPGNRGVIWAMSAWEREQKERKTRGKTSVTGASRGHTTTGCGE